MSRILVFGKDNKQVGEVHAPVTRGWAISDGGSAQFTLTEDESLKPWIQIGRMVYIDGNGRLPNWAGMIDTPWNAIPPVTVTAYDVPYLLSRRSPWRIDIRTGDTRTLAMRFVELANQLGDTYIREGTIQTGDTARSLDVTQTTDWDQLKAVVANAGMEMIFRSAKDSENRLLHYLDIQKIFGEVTQTVLQDGEGGNIEVQSASVDGDFFNAVMGYNNGSTNASRLYSAILTDTVSVDLYGKRNKPVQFTTSVQSDLDEYTKNYLAANGRPTLTLQVGVMDKDQGKTFSKIRLGNVVTVRATKLILPGGRKGWSGQARVGAMTYSEASNQMTLSIIGVL